MISKVTLKFGIYLTLYVILAETFSPLQDDILFKIDWNPFGTDVRTFGGPRHEYNIKSNSIEMVTADKERYTCTLPSQVGEADSYMYGQPEAHHAPHLLLAPLFKSEVCTYRIESYWTYEICHGKHLRQYHEERVRSTSKSAAHPTNFVLETESGGKIVVQTTEDKGNNLVKTTEFYLGQMTGKTDKTGVLLNPSEVPNSADAVPSKTIDGISRPYYAVQMDNGTPCDLKPGLKRKSTVLYMCAMHSHNEMISVTETTSCEYQFVVMTPYLCQHPFYQVYEKQVNKIHCVAAQSSPLRPQAAQEFERGLSATEFHASVPETVSTRNVMPAPEDDQTAPKGTKPLQAKKTSQQQQMVRSTRISSVVDHALLDDFLSGEYCLHGGSGWWRFEFCYGKHVAQYHEERSTNADGKRHRTTVMIGRWDEQAHRRWVSEEGGKARFYIPGDSQEVRTVAHLYADGDTCDLTGKPRKVVVKLKCRKNSESQHAVVIYLHEPTTCSYVLTVESAIVCDLLNTADQFGILHKTD